MPHLTFTQPGGMPGLPVLTGIALASTNVRITWEGPAGYYRLVQKSSLTDPQWQPAGGPYAAWQATLPVHPGNAFFRLSGPAPQYAGARPCATCHGQIYGTEINTPHPHALDLLARIPDSVLPNCLPCHTVGYGLPTGYNDPTNNFASPLAGAQCESCHGPAASHAASEDDPTVRPRVDLAAEVCGGCHVFSRRPAYPEWMESGHHDSVFANLNRPSRLSACGRCHSGTVRVALLKGQDPSVTVTNDANVPVVCATCHDPHATHVYTNVLTGAISTNQVRNPVASLRDYFLNTNDVFATRYDPEINICGQCHNHRGASWTNSLSAPHPSPQYNMLLGTVGELLNGPATNEPAPHALEIETQCVACHMQRVEFQAGPPAVQPDTGHRFRVESFTVCLDCHEDPEGLVAFVSNSVSEQLQELKGSLDLWATTKAPDALRKYGVRAWEYTQPGALSNGPDDTQPGPSPAEPTLIPVNIQNARFNLYLVVLDGSSGVHNAPHTAALLDAARTWIQVELSR